MDHIQILHRDVLRIIIHEAGALYTATRVCRSWRNVALAEIAAEIERGFRWRGLNVFYHSTVPQRQDFAAVTDARAVAEMVRRAPGIVDAAFIADAPPHIALAALNAVLQPGGKEIRRWWPQFSTQLLPSVSCYHRVDLTSTARTALEVVAELLRVNIGPFEREIINYILDRLDGNVHGIVVTITAVWMQRMQLSDKTHKRFLRCAYTLEQTAPRCADYLGWVLARMHQYYIGECEIYCARQKRLGRDR